MNKDNEKNIKIISENEVLQQSMISSKSDKGGIGIKDEKIKNNFEMIKDELQGVQVNTKEAAKNKSVMLKAFEYFGKEISKLSLENLGKFGSCFDFNEDDAGKRKLLNIFSDKEKISNIEVEFVSSGTENEEGVGEMAHFVVKFNCNGQKQKIELWDIEDNKFVNIYYFFVYDNKNTEIIFEFKYDQLDLK